MADGVFITFEGGEGSGKSTQARLFLERLADRHITAYALREPGGTVVGDRVRDLLLDPAHTELEPMAELLLYEASRAELVAKEIRPRLEAGAVVVCDRFCDSTTAYQGYGRGLDLGLIAMLNDAATGGLIPALTVLLDVDPQVGLRRATVATADRLEREALEFHRRVREGFLAVAKAEPGRVLVVPSVQGEAEVAAAVWEAVAGHRAMRRVLH